MSGITVYSDKCHLCGMYFTYTLKIRFVNSLSEETAHSTVYHHLSQQSSCINTAQSSLRWRYTVEWAVSSESVTLICPEP